MSPDEILNRFRGTVKGGGNTKGSYDPGDPGSIISSFYKRYNTARIDPSRQARAGGLENLDANQLASLGYKPSDIPNSVVNRQKNLESAIMNIAGASGDNYRTTTRQNIAPVPYNPTYLAKQSPVFQANADAINADPNRFGSGRGVANNAKYESLGQIPEAFNNALYGGLLREAIRLGSYVNPAMRYKVGKNGETAADLAIQAYAPEPGTRKNSLNPTPVSQYSQDAQLARLVGSAAKAGVETIATGGLGKAVNAAATGTRTAGKLAEALPTIGKYAPAAAESLATSLFQTAANGGDIARGTAEGVAYDLAFRSVGKIAQGLTRLGKLRESNIGDLTIGSDAMGPMDKKAVSKYVDDIKSGKPLAPIVVTKEKGKLFVQDGKHRLEAARQAGLDAVPVVNKNDFKEGALVYYDKFNGPLKLQEPVKPNVQPEAVSGLDKIGQSSTTKPGGIIDQLKNKASAAYTATIDRYNPLVNVGKQAGERKAVENALAGHYGATSTANYHVDYELKPIFNELPKGVKDGDFRALLVAQRDAELAARGIKGSDATVAGATLDKLKSKLGEEKFAQLQESAQKLYAYQRNIVEEHLVKTGIISQDAADAMFAKNQAYVPFQRVLDNVEAKAGQSNAAASVGSQDLIKGIKGSDKQIKDPIESIVSNTYRAVAIGKRNETAKVIAGLADKLPEGTISRVTKEVPGGNYISVFENGKKVSYAVPKEVADSAKALNAEQMNTIVKILSAPTRLFRATATGINPEFMLPNVTRDLQQAFVTAGVSPVGFVRGLYHYLKKDDVYQAFLKSGGLTSRVSLDPKSLQKSVAEITGTNGIQAANPKRLYSLLEEVGAASEQPTRIAAFQKALKKELKSGVPQEEALLTAARAAQESSTNFARRGEATQAVNAIYAFMNARVQGTDKLIRSIKENPAGAGTRLGMITITPAVALYMYNRQYDNYRDPRVVSDYDKQNNFIIMAPWLGEDKFIKIPKGDVGRLANPIEASLEYLDGKKTGKDIGDTALKSLSAFSPVQNIGDAIPTALRPGVETAANYNFFTGRPIVQDYQKAYPAEAQFSANTPAIYRQIGDMLNMSPAKIQNLVEGYTTGIGKMTAQYASKFSPQQYQEGTTPKGDSINQTPIARRFIGGAKQSKEEYSTQLAKQINALDYSKTDLKAALNKGTLSQTQYDKSVREIEKQQNDIKTKAKVDGYSSQLESSLRQLEDAKKQKAKETRAKNKKR